MLAFFAVKKGATNRYSVFDKFMSGVILEPVTYVIYDRKYI